MLSENIEDSNNIYIDREFSNANVKQQINAKLNNAGSKPMEMLSEYHKRSRIKYMLKLIAAGTKEPGTRVTFDPITLQPLDHGKKRTGRPRLNWYEVTIQDTFSEARKHINTIRFAASFDAKNKVHIDALIEYAEKQ